MMNQTAVLPNFPIMTGCSIWYHSTRLPVRFYQERHNLVLTISVDKGTTSVHVGKDCILKKPRMHTNHFLPFRMG